MVDDERRIVHDPPLLVRLDVSKVELRQSLRELFIAYYDSLEDSRKRLVSRFRFVDVAHKVVGVGSVGTRCFITLWQGLDEDAPLFIQVKEARPSLLEQYLGRSEYDHPGQRVISGQRLMQSTHDIFLGFGEFEGHAYFIRQLYDRYERPRRSGYGQGSYLAHYAELCAAVLARAHARTGDAAQIAGYLGKGKKFDKALTRFAFRYADQNDADWRAFRQAVADGRLEAAEPE